MIYQLKIQLQGVTKPPVWRRILIPSDASFENLHQVIQTAFGWENYHLFMFTERPYDRGWEITNERNQDGGFGFLTERLMARDVPIQDYLNPDIPTIIYTYDFGDDWHHKITLEDADVKDCPDPTHAHCIAGKGVSALEDCGGVYGFMEMREEFINNYQNKSKKTAKKTADDTQDAGESKAKKKAAKKEPEMIRWVGGEYLEIDKNGKPDFSKIDVGSLDAAISRIPLTILKTTGKRKTTRRYRGDKITTRDEAEIQRIAMAILGQYLGGKLKL